MATTGPVVRVSIIRCSKERFDRVVAMMVAAQALLEPGIRLLPGLIDYYAGSDRASLSLTNTSIWRTLEDAERMATFQPMLDLAKRFTAEGVTFERPIMNYATLWRIDPS